MSVTFHFPVVHCGMLDVKGETQSQRPKFSFFEGISRALRHYNEHDGEILPVKLYEKYGKKYIEGEEKTESEITPVEDSE